MILPFTLYTTSKALAVQAYSTSEQTTLIGELELAAGASFRVALDNDPEAEVLRIQLPGDYPAELTGAGAKEGTYYIDRQKLEQDCVLTTDFTTAIYFYTPQDGAFGAFSNFSLHGFSYLGQYFATAEHYYQSQKFTDAHFRERVIRSATPKEAADLGKTQSTALRPDWSLVKIGVMHTALLCKFRTHAGIRDLLLSTGDTLIIENSPFDNFWGIGRTGTGKNHLGTLLMQVHAQLRSEA